MSPTDLRHIAEVCSILLVIWEALRRRRAGAILSALAAGSLLFITSKAGLFLTVILAIPVILEERWNPRARKDLIRGVLAAGVIAGSLALALVYGG